MEEEKKRTSHLLLEGKGKEKEQVYPAFPSFLFFSCLILSYLFTVGRNGMERRGEERNGEGERKKKKEEERGKKKRKRNAPSISF